jgi:pimeloyl-ACP methyl ester carboxylesterase
MTIIEQAPVRANPLDVDRIAHRFLMPKRSEPKAWPPGTAAITLTVEASGAWPDGPQVEVVCHQLGEGPIVLLVHGWQAQAADLMPLVHAVVDAGFSVWALDLPAHGHSAGTHLSIPLAARALLEVGRQAGNLHAAIAHSFGGACLVQALSQGLQTAKVVLLAPPTHYGHYVRQMAQAVGMEPAAIPALLQRLEYLIGQAPDQIVMENQAASLQQPACLIHAADDPVVPSQAAHRVAQVWPGARWHLLEGLGHFRILSDGAVHALIVQELRFP